MWNQKKLEDYISDKIEENIHLDYKSAAALGTSEGKRKEIAKDISAFANSDGGIIIYGIREFQEEEKRHMPEKIDPVNRKEFTKEWLEQVISGNIAPKIQDLKITPVTIDDSDDKVVYVVEIKKGNTAHQSKDKRYYKRYNFESQMMDDWEIKDIINRVSKTQIEILLEPRIRRNILKDILGNTQDYSVDFQVRAFNSGNKVAKYIDCYFTANKDVYKYLIEPRPKRSKSHFELLFSNEIENRIEIDGKRVKLNTERFVILPNTWRELGVLSVKAGLLKEEHELKVATSTEDNYVVKNFKTNKLLD